LRPLSGTLLTPPLYLGLLFLCTLPSTVQDQVAFTSIAGGNVAAALCGASASSLFGIFLTPLLTFAGHALGLIVLPLTVFYQIRLHGLRRARPAPRQGCEIARNSHPLRWVFAVNRIPLSEVWHSIEAERPLVTIEAGSVCRDSKAFARLEWFQM